MSDFFISRRLFSFFIVGLLGTPLVGCREESVVGNSNPATTAFGPTLVIKANATGLSAEEMSSLIAAPIEKHFAALDELPLVEAICTAGQAEFILHTRSGCNLKRLESLIRDRVASAKESLPQIVDEAGLQIQSKTAPLFIVTVYSPDGKFDSQYLRNFVRKELRDQLTRIPGVGEVSVVGMNPPSDEVLVKQYPGIALLLAPTGDAKAAEVAADLQKRLGEIRPELPSGMLLTLPINAARLQASETNLVLELQPPDGTDEPRKLAALKNVCAMLQEFRGLKNLVGFSRNPVETAGNNPCIVLSIAGDESRSTEQRAALQQLCDTNSTMRVRLKSFGKPDESTLRAAISGPDVKVADELSGKLAEQLRQTGKHRAEQQRSPSAIVPGITVKLDSSKLATLGITNAEIAASLSETLNQPLKADQTRGTIALPNNSNLSSAGGLAQLRVKNSTGQEIALSDVAGIESVPMKLVVYRVNNQPAVLLAVQTRGGQNSKEAREQINTSFNAAREGMMLGEEYKLTWLED